jgi:peptide/nickel transport system permease protein
MSEELKKNNSLNEEQEYSLNDDRRVKTLSPGALTAKRFFRNRLAVLGLVILALMFLFSYVGGWLMPYDQDQLFYRDEIQMKEYAGVTENTEWRYLAADGQEFGAVKAWETLNDQMQSELSVG